MKKNVRNLSLILCLLLLGSCTAPIYVYRGNYEIGDCVQHKATKQKGIIFQIEHMANHTDSSFTKDQILRCHLYNNVGYIIEYTWKLEHAKRAWHHSMVYRLDSCGGK